MKKVLVIGEVLLRLTPPNNLKIGQATKFEVCFGGAEANVAIGLANLSVESKLLTCMPPNELGDSALKYLKSFGVDCENVLIKGERLGLYYYEEACSARRANVIYDRKYSSITELRFDELELEKIFEDVELLHVSGITLGLGEECRESVVKIVDEAKKRNIKISVDLNYRSKLFNSYKEFVEVLKPIVKDSYLCFGWLNRDTDNFKVLDPSSEDVNGESLIEKFKYMTEDLNVKYVATTLRTATAYNKHSLKGVFFDGKEIHRSSKYQFSMISRIGGGDAFAAGLLYCLVEGSANYKELIEFATATAVLKHTQKGDVSLSTKDDVLALISNKNLGSVNR